MEQLPCFQDSGSFSELGPVSTGNEPCPRTIYASHVSPTLFLQPHLNYNLYPRLEAGGSLEVKLKGKLFIAQAV